MQESGTSGATLGPHVRIVRHDLRDAIARMNPAVMQTTVIEALNELYGPPAIHILQLKTLSHDTHLDNRAEPCAYCAQR